MRLSLAICCAFSILLVTGARGGLPEGDATIRAKAGSSEIVINTTARLAGAIDSLTYNGMEFINSSDHGRQLQSASNFDGGKPFFPEVFNPTEAGSRHDGAGPKSTSRLLKIKASANELSTTIQPAFWLLPGEKSEGHPAVNKTALSEHPITKRVHIGHELGDNIIEYDVTFDVPAGEGHMYAQFEALTGYMPPAFEKFWIFHTKKEMLEPLSDGPGEQSQPVILATSTGSHAMGIITPERSPGYGRFRFVNEKVVKWNCVFRERNASGIKPGPYSYKMFVVVGTLEEVKEALARIHKSFRVTH